MTIPTHEYTPVARAVPITGSGGGDNDGLGESFISMPADTPSPEAQPYLEVVAPATLPEGYEFEAEANGQSFNVKVPVGGVEEGQKFSVPFPAGADAYSGAAIPRASVPVGNWKDGVCDCFRLGLIHPVVWNAWCCPLIIAGQVMHRLKLTWLGSNAASVAQTAPTFRICLCITLIYVTIDQTLGYSPILLGEDPTQRDSDIVATIYFWKNTLRLLFYLFVVVVAARTRKNIRMRYSIPERQCQGCEDVCCMLWCHCCTLAQMARHTADYDTYAGYCCSETGMPPHAPSIV
eukprot:CAMPEP_0183727298 /NCGR_PEP_ID=MMETSP0737-20130205/25325_1 /TAXON_ID=385413 /ORGANISM="Thalassiosira miniscula, Strain CCMP1093" /LENGTH=290 /DNA_ID=CAMNT_0025958891 /DNA_START=40 /DNA_END=912 /DNA_ORIENTATION=+